MTKWSVLINIGVIFAWVSGVQAQQFSDNISESLTNYRAGLDRYCVYCHNETLKTANLMLDKANVDDLSQDPQVWEKVTRKLRTKSMPPVGMPRPEAAFYTSFSTYLENELDKINAASPNPGRTVSAHRLNRSEYTNAIRDLLGLEIDGASLLPPDNSGGFDNLGDLLSVSQVLMEKYMLVAKSISRLAIGDPSISMDIQEYSISPFLLQNNRMSEDLPFGSRGGFAIHNYFPLDGEYEFNIRLQRTAEEALIMGLAEPHRLDVRVDGERIKLFTVGGENVGVARSGGFRMADFNQSEYESTADDSLVVRFPVKAGTKVVQVAFLEENYAWEGLIPPPSYNNYSEANLSEPHVRPWAKPAVAAISIVGPYNAIGPGRTVSRERIFICTPSDKDEEAPCALNIISNLARLAYRRPVAEEDIGTLKRLYLQGVEDYGTFEAGIQMMLEGLLVSTGFLFRIESEPENVAKDTNYPVSDLELASRLAFFLWSSLPDEQLLRAAERGVLREDTVLEQQVMRMLMDDRSIALVDNFAEQWLMLRNLSYVNKNQDLFPAFDENLRKDFLKETQLFIREIFRENRSILDFFQADFRFLNERLAKHYEIPNIYGNRFRRVIMTDENKQGLLAQGAILAITSYPNRTSPVLRGKWVLGSLLASPPPDPPVDIPALQEKAVSGEVFTMREAIEKHRENPVCAVCHNQMDPIGFGLENFNPVGQWRTEDAGKPIDSSGVLPDGTEFQGPAELQRALLGQPDVIVSAFVQNILKYALGRELTYYDMTTVRNIVNTASKDNYRFSTIVLGVVKSLPFQMRRAAP